MTYKIRINPTPCAFSEASSETCVETREQAIVYLWALAKQDIPEFGICWLPMAIEPMTNIDMFSAEPPASLKQKINAVILSLNEQDIESLVVQGLNTIYQGLSRHGSDPEFVERVTSAAKEWAKDCYQY